MQPKLGYVKATFGPQPRSCANRFAFAAMVVAELLKWRAPAVLMLLLVMLTQNSKLAIPDHQLANEFVEVFAGDAAVSLALWDRGLVGSCHDIRYTSLMDMSSNHGFLLLRCKYHQM